MNGSTNRNNKHMFWGATDESRGVCAHTLIEHVGGITGGVESIRDNATTTK